jgi:hypothetical protein
MPNHHFGSCLGCGGAVCTDTPKAAVSRPGTLNRWRAHNCGQGEHAWLFVTMLVNSIRPIGHRSVCWIFHIGMWRGMHEESELIPATAFVVTCAWMGRRKSPTVRQQWSLKDRGSILGKEQRFVSASKMSRLILRSTQWVRRLFARGQNCWSVKLIAPTGVRVNEQSCNCVALFVLMAWHGQLDKWL